MFTRNTFKPNGYRYEGIPAQWNYQTDDALSDVTVAGYFADNKHGVKKGDFVFCETSGGSFVLTMVDSESAISADQAVLSLSVSSVANVAALRNLSPVYDGQQVKTLGHTLAGVGGGIFRADFSDMVSVDNNATVIKTVDDYRWVRIVEGAGMPEMCGAVGVGDESAQLQLAGEIFDKVIISKAYIGGGIALLNKVVNFEFIGEGKITCGYLVDGIFILENCDSTFTNPNLDGAGLARRGITQDGGKLDVVGGSNKIANFTSDDDFAAGVFGVSLSEFSVNKCSIYNIIGTPNGVYADASGAARGVYAQNCQGVSVSGCNIFDVGGEEGDSIHIASGSVGASVFGNIITGFTRRGIKVQADGAHVYSNKIKESSINVGAGDPQSGIEIVSGVGCKVFNNDINTPATPSGIQVSGDGCLIEGNTVVSGPYDAGQGGLLFRQRAIVCSSENSKITNNMVSSGFSAIEMRKGGTVSGNTSIDAENKAFVIGSYGAASKNISFSGNTVIATDALRFSQSPILIVNHTKGSFSGTVFESFDGLTNNVYTLSGSTNNRFSGTVSNQEYTELSGSIDGNFYEGSLTGVVEFDAPSMLDGEQVETTLSIVGAKIGDFVAVAAGYNYAGLEVLGYVSSADTITIVVKNRTGGIADKVSAYYRVRVTAY